MTNLAEVRRVATEMGYLNQDGSPGPKARALGWADAGGWTQASRDLAIKAGYINENVFRQQSLRAIAAVMPDVYVGQATPPERRAEYVAAGFTLVELDEPRAAEIRTDPLTGRREYVAAYQPGGIYAAATGGPASSPPAIMEQPRNMWLNGSTVIDRFSLSPGRDSVLQQLNERDLVGGAAGAPKMFGTGDLPRFTASGVDPGELRWCAWQLRTSAAFEPSRARVLEMIMASAEPALDETLQSSIGREHLNVYFAAIQSWANQVPEGEDLQGLTPAEIQRFYPDGADTGE